MRSVRFIIRAVGQAGESLESFTAAMKKNLREFLTNGSAIVKSEVSGLIEKTEEITKGLTADLSQAVTSTEIQKNRRRIGRLYE